MTRTARLEGWLQIVIMLLMGGMAGAASFTHIHDLALAYGQPSWIGWANAVVVELMSIVAGLEIRRRKRTGQSSGFVYLVFSVAVFISLCAQVAKAHPSPWGWTMAALPALGFLAVVKIVLTRQPVEPPPNRPLTDHNGPVQNLDRTPDRDTPTPMTGPASPSRTGPGRTAAADTGPVDVADQARAAKARTGFAGPAGHADASPAERTSVDTPSAIKRTYDPMASRSINATLMPAHQTHGHDGAFVDAEPVFGPMPRSRPGSHRTSSGRAGDRSSTGVVGPVRDRTRQEARGPGRDRSGAATPVLDRSGPDDELLEIGRTIAAKVTMRNGKLTRQTLIDGIRGEGGTISTDRASDLLRLLKTDDTASPAMR